MALCSADGGSFIRNRWLKTPLKWFYLSAIFTRESAIEWAENIGPSTVTVIHFILDTYQTEKIALQSIFSLKKSERRYTKYEIERACKMVVSVTKRPTVKSIQTVLKNSKKNDAEKKLKRNKEVSENSYGFTRGASYYGGVDE